MVWNKGLDIGGQVHDILDIIEEVAEPPETVIVTPSASTLACPHVITYFYVKRQTAMWGLLLLPGLIYVFCSSCGVPRVMRSVISSILLDTHHVYIRT